MKKGNIAMLVLVFFSATMVIGGGIAISMELLTAEEGSPAGNLPPLVVSLVGNLGLCVSAVLCSLRSRISELEDRLKAE